MNDKLYKTIIKHIYDSPYIEFALFNTGPVVTVIWGINDHWPVLQVSDNVRDITGYSKSDLINYSLDFFSIIHPDDLERIKNEVNDCYEKNVDLFIQSYRLKLKNDQYRWFLDVKRIIRNESGELVFIVGYLIDQMYDKENQKNFLNNLQHFTNGDMWLSSQSMNITDVVFAADLNFNLTYISSSIENITGFSPEELINTSLYEILTEQSATEMHAFLQEEIQKEQDPEAEKIQTKIIESEINNKNGSVEDIALTISFLKDHNGHPNGLQGVIRNITDRKKAEAMLKSTNEMLQLIMNNIPQFIFWKDTNSVYLGCNENFAVVAGIQSPDEITGKTDYELSWRKEEADFFVECDQRIMSSGIAEYNIIEPQLQSNGKQAWLKTNKIPLFNNSGEVIGILGTYEDITEKKIIEDQTIEREKRVTQQKTAIAQLALDQSLHSGDVQVALEYITKIVSESLQIERISIWKLADKNSKLQCLKMYELKSKTFNGRESLKTNDFPKYFETLKNESLISAEDAQHDERTSELTSLYLEPNRITSILDAGILIEGNLVGVVCCEHTGVKRKWHNDEESFLSTVAAITAQLLINAEKKCTAHRLLESEENLKITLNSIGDGVIATDIDGIITKINPVAQILTGWNIDEATGKQLTEVFNIFNIRTGEKIENPINRVFETGEIVELNNNTLLISKNQKKYHIADSAAPMKNAYGEIVGVVIVFRDITQEHEATQALADSEKKYRELYQNLNEGTASSSLDGKILEFNVAFQMMIGFQAEEIKNLSFYDFTPEKWHEFEKKIINEQVLIRGFSDTYEKELVRKDGTVFPVEITTYLTKDQDNNPVGYWGLVRDITERKKAEKSTLLNFKRSQILLQLGQMTDATLKEITNFTVENAVEITESQIGYLAFLNEDETVLSMYAWSEAAMQECAVTDKQIEFPVCETGLWGEVVRQRKPMITNNFTAENHFKKGMPEGHIQVKRHMNIPVFSGDKIVMVAGVGNKESDYNDNDVQQLTLIMQGLWRIIEKNKYENELRIFRESLENSTDAIGMSTPEGKHYYQNRAFTELFGKIGENPSECLFVDTSVAEEVFKAISSGLAWTGEVQMYDRNKKIIDILLRAYANKDSKGNITALVGIHTDISNKKVFEKEIMLAKEKAEESDRLKSVFLANVSHEIRTPMNAILGFLELLRGEGLSQERMKGYIEIVNQSGKRLLNTINDIIEISKIEAGQSEVYISEVNVSEIMKFHQDFFRQQCFDKGLMLKKNEQIHFEQSIVMTDKHKLEGILTNLLNNALKFTHEGSIEFGNRIEDDMMLFYVSDTGMGIPEKKLNAVFERFVQAGTKKSRSHEGSGLGLSIVKAYLDMLGGKIWVESEVNKGSTFYFTIPFKPVKPELYQKSMNENKDSNGNRKEFKMLVFDDDELNFQYMEKVLNEEQISFVHAENEATAIQSLSEKNEVTLVLVNIKMPEMNELSLIKKIRAINRNIPIVGLTAYVWSEHSEYSIDVRCDDFILKPVNRTELLRVINKYSN